MAICTAMANGPDAATAARRARLGLMVMLLAALDRWIERHRQRNALLGLNDPLLKDIGFSRADAIRESDKAFWQP